MSIVWKLGKCSHTGTQNNEHCSIWFMPKSHLSWTPELRRARKQSRRYPIHYELLSMAHAELTPAAKGVRPSLDTPDAVAVGNCDALVPVAGDTGNSDTLVKELQSLQGQDVRQHTMRRYAIWMSTTSERCWIY